MADSTLNQFVATGTTAERLAFTPTPPTPPSGPDPGYTWFDTDDSTLYAYDFGAAAWAPAVTGGAGTVTNTGTLTSGKTIVGNGSADVTVSSLTATVVNSSSGTLGSASTTGSGNVVLATSPTLVTPALGTPSSGTLTNCSGLPAATGLTGVVPGTQGGGLVLLESHTASSSSSLDFTTCISSTYDEYLIDFLNIIPASNSTLQMLMSTNGGSSYDTSNIYTWYSSFAYSLTTGKAGAANAGAFSFRDTTTTLTANSSYNGSVRFYNPGASVFKYLTGQHLFSDNSAGLITFAWGGQYASTTAVNAFRFNFASGNITSGTIRVYGVAK